MLNKKTQIILLFSLLSLKLEAAIPNCLLRLLSVSSGHSKAGPLVAETEITPEQSLQKEILVEIASLEAHQLLQLDPHLRASSRVSPQLLRQFPKMLKAVEVPSEFFKSIGITLSEEQIKNINSNASSQSFVQINEMSFKVTDEGRLYLDNLHPRTHSAYSKLGSLFGTPAVGMFGITPDGKFAVEQYFSSENREVYYIHEIDLDFIKENRDEMNAFATAFYVGRPYGLIERILPSFQGIFSKWHAMQSARP